MTNFELIASKTLAYLPKLFAATLGAILSLILSQDIDKEGNIKINKKLIVKLTLSIFVALFLGQTLIEYFQWEIHSSAFQGTVMLFCGLFGLLVLGIIYQSIELYKGKSLGEIIKEIRDAFTAIMGR